MVDVVLAILAVLSLVMGVMTWRARSEVRYLRRSLLGLRLRRWC